MTENDIKFHDSLKKARAHFEKKEHKNARLMYFQALNLATTKRIRASSGQKSVGSIIMKRIIKRGDKKMSPAAKISLK